MGTVGRPSSILVLGLGNPILGDDGVGWAVAQQVRAEVAQEIAIEVDFAALGGLSLMERMLGYRKVVLIDAIETGASPEGTVSSFPLASLPNPMWGHTASTHDTSLMTALQAAKAMGADIPGTVLVVAIEAKRTYDFSEKLSPRVAEAARVATRKVLELLRDKLN